MNHTRRHSRRHLGCFFLGVDAMHASMPVTTGALQQGPQRGEKCYVLLVGTSPCTPYRWDTPKPMNARYTCFVKCHEDSSQHVSIPAICTLCSVLVRYPSIHSTSTPYSTSSNMMLCLVSTSWGNAGELES